jgi:hypothetical protein
MAKTGAERQQAYRDRLREEREAATMTDATEKSEAASLDSEAASGDTTLTEDALAEALRALKLYWTLPLNSTGRICVWSGRLAHWPNY